MNQMGKIQESGLEEDTIASSHCSIGDRIVLNHWGHTPSHLFVEWLQRVSKVIL